MFNVGDRVKCSCVHCAKCDDVPIGVIQKVEADSIEILWSDQTYPVRRGLYNLIRIPDPDVAHMVNEYLAELT